MLSLFRNVMLFLMTFMCTSCYPEDKTLRVGIYMDNAPYCYVENGKYAGFEVELVENIAKSMNRDLKLIGLEFNELISSVKDKSVDISIGSITNTVDRAKAVALSSEYRQAEDTLCLSTVKNSPDSVESLSILDDKSGQFIVQSGTIFESMINKNISKSKTKIITNLSNVMSIMEKTPSYLLCDSNTVKKLYSVIRDSQIITIKSNNKVSGYVIATNPRDKELLNGINKYLSNEYVKSDKEKLQNKYFGNNHISVSTQK